MTGADLISKRTRNAFREELVGWTLAEITTEFDNEGFKPDHRHDPPVGGQRRGLVEQLYRRIDFADPRQVVRVLEVYQTVVVRARRYNAEVAEAPRPPAPRRRRHHGGVQAAAARTFAAAAVKRCRHEYDGRPAPCPDRAHPRLDRSRPRTGHRNGQGAGGNYCKTILADLGEEHTTLDLGDLVKAASRALKLLPDGVPNEAKGADAIKKTLRSLGATVAGLGEMRNLYGSGHGQDGRARGLTARHARLAVGAASTLAMFLFETHDARRH